MRLLQLQLLAYGGFTDTTLRFADDGAKLHLVYGPNEAGKSTALRAIKALFYGIPERTSAAFLHRYEKLRIGASLRDGKGVVREVQRRKGSKHTLLDGAGNTLTAVDETWLSAGIVEPQFDALFGLSYATLEAKAHELLGGEGGLGESLLGASLGGRSVHRVLAELRAEADAIYRPRGRNQKLNEALAALEADKQRIRDESQNADKHAVQERGIADAERNVDVLRGKRQQLRTERERLERANRVAPALGRRVELARERAALGEVRILAADAGEQRARVEEALRSERRRIQELTSEIESLSVEVPEGVDVPGNRSLDPALARQIREHAAALPSLQGSAARLDKALALRDLEIARLQERQRSHFATLARTESAALPLLAGLALPSVELVTDYERRFGDLDGVAAALRERRRDTQRALETLQGEQAALVGADSLPSEAELGEQRRARDQGWSRLRELLSTGRVDAEAQVLVERHQAWIERTDVLSDRLRREAARVEKHARLLVDSAALEAREREHAAEEARLQSDAEALGAEWVDLWRAAGVSPGLPRPMSAWLREQRDLDASLDRARNERRPLEEERAELQARITRWHETWAQLMRAVDLPATALVAEAESRIDAQLARVAAQRGLQSKHQQLTASRQRLEAAQRELEVLMTAAGVTEPGELPACELRSQRARELDAELVKLRAQILDAADGRSLDALEDDLRDVRVEEVRARLVELEDEIEEVDRETEHAASDLATKRLGLEALRQGRGAADAAEQAAERVTKIRELGQRYAQLRMAAALLEQEVARFRERHKGPLLQVAGEYFSRLTLGSFSDLQADYGEADQAVLVCVRPNGERVPVAGLSDGTRDQLYFALRLSSVRELASKQEPLPLLLDDVLVHFDEARARVALQLLVETAQATQVLLFTHHEHVRELARTTLAPEHLDVHELPAPSR